MGYPAPPAHCRKNSQNRFQLRLDLKDLKKSNACSQPIFFATQREFYEGQLANYSRNGLFIKTKVDLQLGILITVVDPHPDGEVKKRQGQIIWKNTEGIGVELFHARKDREQKVLRFEKKILNPKS